MKIRAARRPVQNPLNDLTGREWLFWTNSVWETTYPVDPTHSLRKRHGAMKPPAAMAEIVRFFTKRGELVLDPFAGVGGVLLGAELEGRRGLGFEINPEWVAVYERIQDEFGIQDGAFVRGSGCAVEAELRCGDCMRLIEDLPDGSVHAIICDPPYGVGHAATGFSEETNFGMGTSGAGDFGAAATTEAFLEHMRAFGAEATRVLVAGRYLVMLIGDRYRAGEYVPLGAMVAQALRDAGLKLKGMKVWMNRATQRPLRPYAIGRVFVPNITHQHVLVLRKES